MDRRETIIKTAARIFQEKGYAETSMRDIADAVGILKGSLYHHIASKEDMLYEIIDRFVDRMIEKAEARRASETLSPRELLEAILVDILEVIRDERDFIEVYFHERRHLSEKRWKAIEKKRSVYEEMVREILRRGQRDGSLRAEFDERIVTLALFGMVNWSIHWLNPNGRLSVERIARIFTTLFFEGLSARETTRRPYERAK